MLIRRDNTIIGNFVRDRPIGTVFVSALLFVLLTSGIEMALAEESSSSPPYGYDQGVWILQNRTSTIEKSEDTNCYAQTLSVAGNSMTGSTSWDDSICGGGGDCSGHFSGTCTWTVPSSVLTPGTKQELTTTASVEGGQSCSARYTGAWVSMYEYLPNEIPLRPCANVAWYTSEPKPAPVSEVVSWEVPWGKIGDTITIGVYPHQMAIARGGIFYKYIYQASASLPENHPPTVTLAYSPKDPTEGDGVTLTANAEDPDGDQLTYSWFIGDLEIMYDTRPEIQKQLDAGDYNYKVKVSDGKGGTAEDSVRFTVKETRPEESKLSVSTPCKEARYFYKDSEMAKIYSGTGDSLNYDRDQLVNMMVSAMEKYKDGGGTIDADATNLGDSIALLAAFITGAAPTGKEADLKKKAEEYHKDNGLLTPGDLFYVALRVCGGNVRDALVTTHAVLYRGDPTNKRFIEDHLVPLRNPEAYNNVDRFIKSTKEKDENGKPKLETPREAIGDDQQGVWYHMFGTAAVEFQDEVNVVPWAITRWTMEDSYQAVSSLTASTRTIAQWTEEGGPSIMPSSIVPHIRKMKGWKNPSEIGTELSNYAIALENLIRSGGGSTADPDKQCINYAGVAIGEALRKYMGKQALNLGLSEPSQTIAGESVSLNPKVTILGESPVSMKIEGKDGEVFFFDQANKQFSGNTPLVILDPFVEEDGTIGLLATPLFEVKNVEIQAVKNGDVTIGVYSYDDKKVAVRSIEVQPEDSYIIDLTQFIGPDQQPQIILTPVATAPKTVAEETTKNIKIFDTPVILASTWTVKESGPQGNYDGTWTRRPGTNTFDASWSGGSITDVIDIRSVEGNKITLHRHGNNGDYTGTVSPDGKSISGTASWYVPGEKWSVSISAQESQQEPSYGTASKSALAGQWKIIANKNPGKIEFTQTGDGWTGRIWFDVLQRWEDLEHVSFDPATGRVEFLRPMGGFDEQWNSGVLNGDNIEGTLTQKNAPRDTYQWSAQR